MEEVTVKKGYGMCCFLNLARFNSTNQSDEIYKAYLG